MEGKKLRLKVDYKSKVHWMLCDLKSIKTIQDLSAKIQKEYSIEELFLTLDDAILPDKESIEILENGFLIKVNMKKNNAPNLSASQSPRMPVIYEAIEVNEHEASNDLFGKSMQGFSNVKIVRNVMMRQMYEKKRKVLDQNYAAVIIQGFFRRLTHQLRMNRAIQKSGQLISKGIFGFFNSPKKRTKNLGSSSQKLTFSSSFFERIEDINISFRD